jgi:hypothetical protein
MLGPIEFLAEDRGIDVDSHDLEARASTSPPQLNGAPATRRAEDA